MFLQSVSTNLSFVDPSTDDSRRFSVNMIRISSKFHILVNEPSIECDNGVIVDHSDDDNAYLKG